MTSQGDGQMNTGRTALEGIRVLDVTQVMAGPFCAMQLCDMGADVIKIEPPGGDSTRGMAGASGTDSPGFNAVNRGKRGVVLDLKLPAGQDVFRRLARRADIVIENYRPGVMRSFGLDYESLRGDYPGLIYASISGYGQTGPSASKGGFDLDRTGRLGIDVGHRRAGPAAGQGRRAADRSRRRRSSRCRPSSPRFTIAPARAAASTSTRRWSRPASRCPSGSRRSISPRASHLGRSDRRIACSRRIRRSAAPTATSRSAPPTTGCFSGCASCSGTRSGSPTPTSPTPRYACATAPRSSSGSRPSPSGSPRQHWLALFDAAGIPCGPINDYAEAFADPQVRAREMVVDVDHPTLGRLRTLGAPVKMSETPPQARRRAPLLGEHTREVLREIGLDDREIAALIRS